MSSPANPPERGPATRPPETPIKPGTRLSDGTTVSQYLGRSEGGFSYLAENPDAGKVVIKALSAQVVATASAMQDAFDSLLGLREESLQRLVSRGDLAGKPWLVYEFVDGITLRAAVEARTAAGRTFSFRSVYKVLVELTQALQRLHQVTSHGVLTDENVFVVQGGQTKIANIGFSRLMLCALGADSAAFAHSAYIAPEVRGNPWSASEASDFFSLGVIAVALLTGRHPTRENLSELVEEATGQYGKELRALLDACLCDEPGMRIGRGDEFLQQLIGVMHKVRSAGKSGDVSRATGILPAIPTQIQRDEGGRVVPPSLPPPPSSGGPPRPPRPSGEVVPHRSPVHSAALPPVSATAEPVLPGPDAPAPSDVADEPQVAFRPTTKAAEAEDYFAGIVLPSLSAGPSILGGGAGQERWLVHRLGRDYGPFTDEQIKQQLFRDEIDEHTQILDMHTQEMSDLADVAAFSDVVLDYVPKREKRRLEQAERREEVVRQVKRKGSATFVSAGVGAAAVVGVFLYFIRVTPEPFPFDAMVRPFRHTFQVDQPEYEGISADSQLIASLFNFDEPAPAQGGSHRRRGGGGSSGGAEDGEEPLGEEPSDDYVLSFDSSQPARKLTDEEINSTLRENIGRIQSCFQDELRANPRFRGVDVSWSIHPDGRTFNIRVSSSGEVTNTLESCLVRGFRRIRFPQFNDVPMSVRLPFNVR